MNFYLRIFCTCNENQITTPILLTSAANTFLHHIIRRDIAEKIIHRFIIFGQIMTTIFAVTILAIIILGFIPTFSDTILEKLLGSFVIPYVLLLLLAMNKTIYNKTYPANILNFG